MMGEPQMPQSESVREATFGNEKMSARQILEKVKAIPGAQYHVEQAIKSIAQWTNLVEANENHQGYRDTLGEYIDQLNNQLKMVGVTGVGPDMLDELVSQFAEYYPEVFGKDLPLE